MSTLSDSFDSCNYTKRNHNLSDYKKGGFNKNSGLNSLGYLSAQNGRFGMILSKKSTVVDSMAFLEKKKP